MTQVEIGIDQSHFLQSSLREKLLEHLFVGDLLRTLWQKGRRDIEVLRADIDYAGYDLVIECNKVLRHIQLKSSHSAARTSNVTVHLSLADKPCGCVIWINFDATTLQLGPFLWLGAEPGAVLPPLGPRMARQTRAGRAGIKASRPNHRVVAKKEFKELTTMNEVVSALFGV
jgi:hypothetical protein